MRGDYVRKCQKSILKIVRTNWNTILRQPYREVAKKVAKIVNINENSVYNIFTNMCVRENFSKWVLSRMDTVKQKQHCVDDSEYRLASFRRNKQDFLSLCNKIWIQNSEQSSEWKAANEYRCLGEVRMALIKVTGIYEYVVYCDCWQYDLCSDFKANALFFLQNSRKIIFL